MDSLASLTQEQWLKGQFLLVDKPLHWTSFQVVNKVRWALKKRLGLKKIKVGHAGTLDPLATGLLILCVGKWTKKIDSYQSMEKQYTGCFLLGATTPSYDLETDIDKTFPTAHIKKEDLVQIQKQFLGDLLQKPPVFSAIKKEGTRLYEHARKGNQVAVPERKIQINKFEIDSSAFPEIAFKVNCSKGTYIRSLAHDFGQKLQSGAHLTQLRRTKIGKYTVEDAYNLQALIDELTAQ